MPAIEKHKSDLDTPCLILDLDILEQNMQSIQNALRETGKNLRPHAKTHKCSMLAQNQIESGAIGICVAKISEAEALVSAGIKNILITSPVITEAKIKRLAGLVKIDPSVMIVVDNADIITLLNTKLAAKGLFMEVLLDIDVGQHRTGVKPSNAVTMAKHIISCPNLRLKGIQAYAGHVQHIPSYKTRQQTSLECLEPAIRVFQTLQSETDTSIIFSTSGTGTFDIDMNVPEITEFQAGSYVCMDAEYLGIETSAYGIQKKAFAPALRLLTTVISCNHYDFVTVDAGLKTLYKDGGIPQVIIPQNSDLVYDWFGDEHGRISHEDPSRLPVLGDILELVTSHCDPTINLFDTYYLTRGNQVVGTWPIDLRGCSQ